MTQEALAEGEDPTMLLNEILLPAINEVGEIYMSEMSRQLSPEKFDDKSPRAVDNQVRRCRLPVPLCLPMDAQFPEEPEGFRNPCRMQCYALHRR